MNLRLAHRVARRFQAELLTKAWLMGVRRGWLSLLKPQIQDWADVLGAFDALLQFVSNLKDQVTYVRRAPNMNPDFSRTILDAFKKLQEALQEAQSKAQHWYHVATESTDLPQGTFTKEQGDQMFALYRKDFGALLEVQVPTRRNPAKGQWNQTRNGHVTEFFDKVMDLLRDDAARLEKSRQLDPENSDAYGEPTYTEFDLSGMKIVIDDRTIRPPQVREYVGLFREALHLLQAKKLDAVWSGTIFVRCKDCGGVNYNTGGEVGGDYRIRANTIQIYQRPGPGVTHTIIHELAHRYWFRHMDPSQRRHFEDLSLGIPELLDYLAEGIQVGRGAWKPGMMDKVEQRDFQDMRREYQTGKPLLEPEKQLVLNRARDLGFRGVVPVSRYGLSNDEEAFAEVFAHYVLERDMNRDQLESFRSVLSAARTASQIPDPTT